MEIIKAGNGCIYAESSDLNDVRAELRRRGFVCNTRRGWIRADGQVGAIFFDDGKWVALLGEGEA